MIPICAFADGTNIAAPMWLCDVMDSNTLIKTTAYADYSSSGKDFVLKMATTTAAMEALSQLRIKLQTSFINISESSGTEAPPIPLTWLTSVSDQFTVPDVLSLAETRELATPTKGVVVVFQLPKTSTEEWLNTTLQQSPLSGIDSELKSAFIQALLQDLMN